MKKLFVTVVMMSLCFATYAQTGNENTADSTTETTKAVQKDGEIELPVAVKDAINKNYPEATIKEVNEEEKEGITTFEIKLENKDNSLVTVKLTDKGEVIK